MSNTSNTVSDFEYIRNAMVNDATNIILPATLSGAELSKKYNCKPFLSKIPKSKKLFSKYFPTVAAVAACLLLTVTVFIDNNGSINKNAAPMAEIANDEAGVNNEYSMLRSIPEEADGSSSDLPRLAMIPQNYSNEKENSNAALAQSYSGTEDTTESTHYVSPNDLVGSYGIICESILLMSTVKDIEKKKIIEDETETDKILNIVENAVPIKDEFNKDAENIFCTLTLDKGVTELTFYKEPECFTWVGDEILNYSVPNGTFDMLSKLLVS